MNLLAVYVFCAFPRAAVYESGIGKYVIILIQQMVEAVLVCEDYEEIFGNKRVVPSVIILSEEKIVSENQGAFAVFPESSRIDTPLLVSPFHRHTPQDYIQSYSRDCCWTDGGHSKKPPPGS